MRPHTPALLRLYHDYRDSAHSARWLAGQLMDLIKSRFEILLGEVLGEQLRFGAESFRADFLGRRLATSIQDRGRFNDGGEVGRHL